MEIKSIHKTSRLSGQCAVVARLQNVWEVGLDPCEESIEAPEDSV